MAFTYRKRVISYIRFKQRHMNCDRFRSDQRQIGLVHDRRAGKPGKEVKRCSGWIC